MKKNDMISLDTRFLKGYLSLDEIHTIEPKVNRAKESLLTKTCAGHDFLGWVDLPFQNNNDEIDLINQYAAEIKENADYLIVIGIGGSYLGARATIEFLSPAFGANKPQILYFGHQLSMDYAWELLDFLKDKSFYVNVISKSGTTTEPGIAFRIIKDFMQKKYSAAEMKKRIIATTDKQNGALRKLVDSEEYRSLVIPDDVGGRFSVLTPVGLLPIAAAGFNIRDLLDGARAMADICQKSQSTMDNPAVLYAAIRHLLHNNGINIEILSAFEPYLYYVSEWWKQLFGESEGKDGKGLYPASVNFTTDLHSMGQYIQDGNRILLETFLNVASSKRSIDVPFFDQDVDGMNYLAGKELHAVNFEAYQGTALAHHAGKVPGLTINIPERNEKILGQLFYFFEFAVAISGLLLNVNPFNQPGVEDYKKNMFALLGKPGFETQQQQLLNLLKEL